MTKRLIIHAAEVELTRLSGMGRIAWHWREAFERRGFEFVHIGPSAAGRAPHKALWGFKAWEAARPRLREAAAALVHEPLSGIFASRFPATVVFSHGIEARGAALAGEEKTAGSPLRRALTRPLWMMRRRAGLRGLKSARLALVSSTEDAEYLRETLGRAGPVFVFSNGCDPVSQKTREHDPRRSGRALFFGTWLRRKGCDVLAEAARLLEEQGIRYEWTLAGTGMEAAEVLRDWPEGLRDRVRVVPLVRGPEEARLYEEAAVFVLPSRFEGQPLTLLQAMANGCCCVTTRCCGQKDVVTDRVNGLLVAPGSAGELAAALRDVWENPELCARLGAGAAEAARDRSWERVSDEVAEQVLAVCAG